MGGSVSTQVKLCSGGNGGKRSLLKRRTHGSHGSKGKASRSGSAASAQHQHRNLNEPDADGPPRQRAGTASLESSPPPPVKPPEMKEAHKELVRETWVVVEQHISEIGLAAFLSLFQRSPEALSLFPFLKHLDKEDLEFYSQLQHHAIRITGVITMLVKELDKPDFEAHVRDFFVDLGRRHFSYGSRPNQMELLGHAFVDTFIHIFDGDPRQAEVRDAWNKFFSVMIFWMSSGYKFVQNKGAPQPVAIAK